MSRIEELEQRISEMLDADAGAEKEERGGQE